MLSVGILNVDTEDEGLENYNPQLKRMRDRGKTGAAYKRAPKQERENVERNGGRAIPASGSRFRKGDSEVPNITRTECKATEHNSFRVTRGMMDHLDNACRLEGQVPVIEVEFVDNVSNVLDTYCVIRRKDLEHLVTRLADAEGIAPADKRSIRSPEHHGRRIATPKRLRRLPDTRK